MKLSTAHSLLLKIVATLLIGAFCAGWGLMVSLLPTSSTLRIAFVFLILLFLALAWLMRSKTYGPPSDVIKWLLVATVALSIIWPRFIFFPAGGVSVNPQSLSVLFMLALCIALLIINPSASRSEGISIFGAFGIGKLIVVWFCWRVLSSAFGEAPIASIFALLKEVVYFVSFFIFTAILLSYSDADRLLIRTIVLCGLVVSLIGLGEAFVQKNFLIQFAAGGDSDEVANALRSLYAEKIRDGSYRAQSVFTHPIVFAQFVSAALPLAFFLLFSDEEDWIWKVIAFFLIPIGLFAILKSGSRSGLVGILASIGFSSFVIWLRAILRGGYMRIASILVVPFFIVSILVIGKAALDLAMGRSSLEAGSTMVRMEMLKLGMNALESRPLFGYGEGASALIAGITDSKGHTSIDSHLLTLAINSGYPGLALFLVIILLLVGRLALWAARSPGSLGLGAGMVASSIMALLATFFGLSITHNLTLFWSLIALGLFFGKRLSMVNRPHV